MNILLTSAGRRTYLVEYFKEALIKAGVGGEVHVTNSRECPAFYAADEHVISPIIYDADYIPFLLDYCKNNDISLLLPLFDVDVPVLAAHAEEFEAIGTMVVTADVKSAEFCNDKWKMYKLLSGGFKVPKSWLNVDKALADIREGKFHFPLIVKPRRGMGSLAMYEADNEEELAVFAGKVRNDIKKTYLKYEAAADQDNCVIIQEKIEGQEYGLDVANDLDGVCRAVAVKKKEAMRSGETDAAVTVENEYLEKIGRLLGNIVRQRGNLDVDVMERDGAYYVLEMNARFGGGYPFSHAAGMDLPYAIIKWSLGEEVDEDCLKVRPGVRSQKDIRILTGSLDE